MTTPRALALLMTSIALALTGQIVAHAQDADTFTPPGPNVALSKTYTLEPEPNYNLCTEEGDSVQLTDGEHGATDTGSSLWGLAACVGWQRRSPANITIDLGEMTPIAGVSYSTEAGWAGVGFPAAILILASEDGKAFHLIGELRHLSAAHGSPSPGRFTFRTDALSARARYVRLSVVSSANFTFCDEIEVYRGPEELLDKPLEGPIIEDPGGYVSANRTPLAMRNWVAADIARASREVRAALVSAEVRAGLLAALQDATAANAALPDDPGPDYRAVFPLNENHANVLAIVGQLRAQQGDAPLLLWQNNRWARLSLWDAAPADVTAEELGMNVRMMQNEIRGETVNIANNTGRPAVAHVSFQGLPGGGTPEYVEVHAVEYVAMQAGRWEADALPIAERDGEGWVVSLPAGVSRQIWLSFRSVDSLNPGTYQGQMVIDTDGEARLTVPLELTVEAMRYPDEHTLALSMWDYTDGNGHRVLNEGNLAAAVAHMQSYGYNSPWAEAGVFPRPDAGSFDENNQLVEQPDFSRFDAWVEMWPGARYYMIFAHVGTTYAGAAMGTGTFDERVGAAMRAWADHAAEIGIDPKKLAVLLSDEPSGGDADRRILDWAEAIKAAAPEIVIFEDPCHSDPRNAETPGMFEICDILCPLMGHYDDRSEDFRAFYQEMRTPERQLWFYSCGGGPTSNSAIGYYRAQQWKGWKAGATGTAFWAYGDAGGATSSWNAFSAKGEVFSPAYIDSTSVTDGKHWLAIIEGVEDYEYLRILRDRVTALEAAGGGGAALAEAKQLLDTLPDQVIAEVKDGQLDACDRGRARVLDALAALAEE